MYKVFFPRVSKETYTDVLNDMDGSSAITQDFLKEQPVIADAVDMQQAAGACFAAGMAVMYECLKKQINKGE